MTTRQMDEVGRQHIPVTSTVSVNAPYNFTVGHLRAILDASNVPDEARLDITKSSGDQREMSPGYTTIRATWTT